MGTLRSILLATDYRLSSERATEATIRLAKLTQARVTVLHVREEFPTWPVTPLEHQDRLTEWLAAEKIDLQEFLIQSGPPADTITRKAQQLHADLLVIGTGEKIREGQLVIGPVTESILERVSSPVLAVNPHGPALEFKTILCPVDHSELSRRALEDAIHLARLFNGRLVVLSVLPEISWVAAAAETGHLLDVKLEHEAKWMNEFDDFLAGVPLDGINWERIVQRGQPHEQITTTAKELGVDLIVMGATGRTGLLRVLLGSVTRRVLRQLPSSLLVVKDQIVFEDQFLRDLETIDQLVTEGREKLLNADPTEASGKFRQALALDPYHITALDGLATACEQLNLMSESQRYRKRAERLRQATWE